MAWLENVRFVCLPLKIFQLINWLIDWLTDWLKSIYAITMSLIIIFPSVAPLPPSQSQINNVVSQWRVETRAVSDGTSDLIYRNCSIEHFSISYIRFVRPFRLRKKLRQFKAAKTEFKLKFILCAYDMLNGCTRADYRHAY